MPRPGEIYEFVGANSLWYGARIRVTQYLPQANQVWGEAVYVPNNLRQDYMVGSPWRLDLRNLRRVSGGFGQWLKEHS